MSMSNAFRHIREAAAQRDHRSNWIPANIGAVVEGANTIPSPHGGAWIFVTLTKGDQNGAVSEALCHKITPAWNCPVLLSVNKQGFYIVEEVDPARYDMWTSGNDGGVLGSHNVAPHHHDDDTSPLGQDFVRNRRLKDGRVEWRNGDDGPYTVYIHPFDYADANGADTYWPGGTLDLSTYLTVAVNEWQWIKVGMDRTGLVPTAIAGAATPIGIPLDTSDLATVSFSPNLPLAGVLITYNQAIQSQDDITDCSFVRSPGSAVPGTVYYQTVQDNGTPLPQQPILNIIGATVADNPGNNSTDVTVGGGGDVVGPASAVDNNIAVFDGVTGKTIKDGGVTIEYIQEMALAISWFYS